MHFPSEFALKMSTLNEMQNSAFTQIHERSNSSRSANMRSIRSDGNGSISFQSAWFEKSSVQDEPRRQLKAQNPYFKYHLHTIRIDYTDNNLTGERLATRTEIKKAALRIICEASAALKIVKAEPTISMLSGMTMTMHNGSSST